MYRPMLFLSALALTLLAGCNDILGASTPAVPSGDPSGSDGDDESEETPGPSCGDGAVDPGEECDDGNDAASDGCHECRRSCGPFPEFESTLTGTCYRLELEQEKTWRTAETACEDWGGTLATITSVDELAFVQEHIGNDTWIGGHDPPGATSFEWVTGEPWEFESFAEPPVVDDLEACVLISGASALMARSSCDTARFYVCEKAGVGAPVN